MNYNSAAFKAAVAKTGGDETLHLAGPDGRAEDQLQIHRSLGTVPEPGSRYALGCILGSAGLCDQNATFDWDFIGVPGGNQAIVFDVMVVAKTAANLEEAYNFAKWMTFSKEAYLKEVELARAAGSAPKMPVSVDDASIELYKEFVDKPGILTALDNLDNSMVESLAKIVPGYINARWEGKPGIDVGEDKDVNMWYMFNFANRRPLQIRRLLC